MGKSAKRSTDAGLHRPELLATGGRQRLCPNRRGALDRFRVARASRAAVSGHPDGGPADARRSRPDVVVHAPVALLDRPRGRRNGAVRRVRSDAAAGRRLADWWSYGLGTGCMFMASGLVTVFALLAAVRPTPWYDPRYAIPLLGMILGNCMTGVGLGLNTLTTSAVSRRTSVEAQLM